MKWIRVKYKKPPMFKDVLVATKMGQITITCVDASGKFDTYPIISEEKGDKITHWMPLPESPNQTTNEKSLIK